VVAMINYYDHTGAVVTNKIEPDRLSRIGTFGIASLEDDAQQKYLFDLRDEKDVHYYYGIPQAQLDSDNTLMRDIKKQTKQFMGEEVNGSFSVYSTTFESLMVLFASYTKEIQSLP